MTDTAVLEQAQARFTKATAKVRDALTARTGGIAAENSYSAAYQELVKLGAAPKIKRKYVNVKHLGGRK